MMIKLSIRWAAIAVAIVGASCMAHAEELTVNLSGGSVITVEASDQTIDWKTIGSKGEIESVSVNLSQVARIDLTDRPASVQIARVRSLLDLLDHDVYQRRVDAQNELSRPSVGRRFKNLVEAELHNESLEVRARVRQILKSFSKTVKNEKPEYDYLYLNDGKMLVGDVGDFALKFKYRDQDMVVPREYLRRITKTKSGVTDTDQGPVEVKLIHRHADEDFADPARVVDFEEDKEGQDLTNSADVSRVYSNRGVIFEAEKKGYVGISGYPFKFRDLPTDGNSVCAIDLTGAFMNRFRGVIRVSFCEPGLPDRAAGVKQFGVFASRIDNPRDLIMEAYNSDSQLIGCVEATDRYTVFLGIETNEPIAFIRLLTNPYLFEVGRNVDETYVLDHVWFGEPIPLRNAKLAQSGNDFNSILLRSGDLLTVEDVQFGPDSVKVFDPQLKRQYKFKLSEVDSVRLGGRGKPEPTLNTTTQLRLPNPVSDRWMAMLADRSILHVTPGKTFTSTLFDDQELSPQQVIGLWSQRDQIRFPVSGDFKSGKSVLVFPTCRVVGDVRLSEDGVSWKESEKKEQPVFSEGRVEDVTPRFDKFKYATRSESQMPTIWFQQPNRVDPDSGFIGLTDGQHLVLHSDSGFQISQVTDESISVKGPGDFSVVLPISQVHAIKFPK